MLWFFLFIAWIWLLFSIITDIFRSDDLSGWAKALWILFVIIVPWLGALIYLIARGGSMQERPMRAHRASEGAAAVHPGGRLSGPSSADELTKLAQLRDPGVITADEFGRRRRSSSPDPAVLR